MFVFLGLVPLKLIIPCDVLAAVVKAEAGSGRHTEMSQPQDVASGQRSPGVLH